MDATLDRDKQILEISTLQDALAATDVNDPEYSDKQKKLAEAYRLAAAYDRDEQEYYIRQETFEMQRRKEERDAEFDEVRIDNARKEGKRQFTRIALLSGTSLIAVGLIQLVDNFGVIKSTRAFNLATKLIPIAKL